MNAEAHKVTCDGCEWHNESRKIHLAEHVRVLDKRFTRLVQAFRKVGPEANSREIE